MQKREKLIIEHERLVDGYRNKKSGEYSPGLRDIGAEIEKAEKTLFDLKIEQEAKVAEAFKEGKNADKIIKDYGKRIDTEKAKLETLKLKQKGLSEAVKAKELEFKIWDLRKAREQSQELNVRHLRTIKDKERRRRRHFTTWSERWSANVPINSHLRKRFVN